MSREPSGKGPQSWETQTRPSESVRYSSMLGGEFYVVWFNAHDKRFVQAITSIAVRSASACNLRRRTRCRPLLSDKSPPATRGSPVPCLKQLCGGRGSRLSRLSGRCSLLRDCRTLLRCPPLPLRLRDPLTSGSADSPPLRGGGWPSSALRGRSCRLLGYSTQRAQCAVYRVLLPLKISDHTFDVIHVVSPVAPLGVRRSFNSTLNNEL